MCQQIIRIQIPALLVPSITLGKLPNVMVPQFPHLETGDNSIIPVDYYEN